MKTGKAGGRDGSKRAREVEEAAADGSSVHTGKSKQSKVGDKPCYGSEKVNVNGHFIMSRGVVLDCEGALAALKRRDAEEMARREAEVDACRRLLDQAGTTMENAVEIADSDDDEQLKTSLAITPRPVLLKNQPPIDHDISGRKGNQKTEILVNDLEPEEALVDEMQIDKGSRPSIDEEVVLNSVKTASKEVKPGRKAARVISSGGNANPGKGGRGKERNVDEEEGEDCLEEHIFGSPRHKKSKGILKYAEFVEDEPDYEVPMDSDGDRELTREIEDPYEDVWKELAIIARQSKRQDDGERQEGCVHSFEVTIDVGKRCSLCGWVKEDIKDMSFVWRRPCTISKPWARRQRVDSAWNGDGDGMLEEEARLVGIPPLVALSYLKDKMHPHQLEGFKFLSKNLVEKDSGGCMLAFAPGTGKSFLIISFIESFMLQVSNARPMIVAPKSMLRPWTQEFKKWKVEETMVLNLYEAGDDAAKLEMLKQWQKTRSVLLVGYAQCTNMSGEIGRYLTEGPGLMVLDEGHLARTENTKILRSLRRVHTTRRVLLSGTPFNNTFEEFYTTLELVRPNFMKRANAEICPTLNALMAPEPEASEKVSPLLERSSHAGRQAFKDAVGESLFESGKHESISRALGRLQKLIEPFVAWHKGQILETLPGITDLTVMLELSLKQRELLKDDRSEVPDNLHKRAAAIYVHPILEVCRSQKDPRLRDEHIDLKQGIKLRWVLDLVQMCDDVKEKVLIFSEYLYFLALIENMAMLKMKWSKGSQILRIDGSMDTQEREKVINKFNTDVEAKMLCASIKACGEGISLVGASRVVMLEVIWNPSVTRQAISRAFRIGQQKKVVVYRLIAADTYEEQRMHATATRKEWLSKLLFNPSISSVDPNSILRDVTNDCSDMFLLRGPLRNGVKRIYERTF